MNIRAIISIVAILGVLAGAYWQYKDQIHLPNFLHKKGEEAPKTIEAEGDNLVPEQVDETTKVIKNFVKQYSKAVEDTNDKAAEEAYSMLSWRGQTVIQLEEQRIEGLKRFTRDIAPADDIEVVDTRKSGPAFAEVLTKWHTQTETLDRYFYLVLENNEWKIDSIQSVQQ